jgi:hypothetical protein
MSTIPSLERPTGLPPPNPSSAAPPSPTEAVGGRPRRRHRGLIIAGAIFFGIAALGIVGLGLDQALTHDLLSEDFSTDDGVFGSGERSEFEIDVYDGTYRMTTKEPLTYPIRSFGWFARTAYYVDIDATVVAFDADEAGVGLECIQDINADDMEAGYLFLAPTDGSGYLITKMVPDGAGEPEMLAEVEGPVAALRPGQHIGLSCGAKSLLPNAKTTITGTIDGVEVISATDGSYDSFDAAGLVFFSLQAGDSVQFDDVSATVPE